MPSCAFMRCMNPSKRKNKSYGITLPSMTTQHTSRNVKHVNYDNEDDSDMCEATYMMIDSISTQYIDDSKDVDHNMNKEEYNMDVVINSNDVVKSLKSMELMDSASNHEILIENIIHEKTREVKDAMTSNNHNIVDREYGKHNINHNIKRKEIVNFKPLTTPPTSSRWFKTFNKAQEILDQGDIPANTIAKYLHEKHTHETYAESLHELTDTSSTLFKEIDGMMQVKTRNEILLVPMDNFHSYKLSKNYLQCTVCNTTLLEDVNTHKYEVRHMNHVVKLIDHRGMRKIDYKYSHCITCNLRVKNKKEAAAHIKTRQHIQARKLYIKPNVRKVDTLGTGGKEEKLMMDVA